MTIWSSHAAIPEAEADDDLVTVTVLAAASGAVEELRCSSAAQSQFPGDFFAVDLQASQEPRQQEAENAQAEPTCTAGLAAAARQALCCFICGASSASHSSSRRISLAPSAQHPRSSQHTGQDSGQRSSSATSAQGSQSSWLSSQDSAQQGPAERLAVSQARYTFGRIWQQREAEREAYVNRVWRHNVGSVEVMRTFYAESEARVDDLADTDAF